jgi:hypothetical protein
MSTLSQLKTILESNEQGDGTLPLLSNLFSINGDNTIFAKTIDFLDSLTANQLQLTISNPVTKTISGATYPQTLTLGGNISQLWPIKGIGDQELQITQLTFTFTQQAADGPIDETAGFNGTLTINGKTLSVAGNLIEDNKLKFTLPPGSPPSVNFSMTEIADFAAQSSMGGYLPSGLTMFDSMAAASLDLEFGFDAAAHTSIAISCDIGSTEWEFITGYSPIKNIGVTIRGNYRPFNGTTKLSFGGDIHGTFHLGQDYDIIIYFRGQNSWELDIIPANGNIVPGLLELAHMAGGDTLKTSVQTGLDKLKLGELSLDAIKIGFDFSGKSLKYVSILGHITIAGVQFDAYAMLPDFQFGGALAKGSVIHIKSLVKHFFTEADAFPEIGITDLGFSAYPSAGNYTVHARIEDDWAFDIGGGKTAAVKSVEFSVDKGTDGVSGSISGSFNIAGLDIFITAENDEPGAGWQFTGSSATGEGIEIGTLITDIVSKFQLDDSLVPESIKGLTFQNLHVAFNTKSKDFSFKCEADFPVENTDPVKVAITIDLKHTDGNFTKHFAGHITFDGLQFDLVFDKDNSSTTFIAAYHQDGGSTVNVKSLVNALSPTAAGSVPDSLEITLIDALMAYNQTTASGTTDKKFLVELDMSGGVDLTQLPLVGKFFTADQALKLTLQALATSKDFTQDNVGTINDLIPEGVTQLPDAAVNTRLKLNGNMNIGGLTRELELPLAVNDDNATNATQPLKETATASTGVKWIKLQKNFGPLHIERVGVSYKDSNLWFLLDAALAVGGLNLSLEGLSVHSPLNTFHPVFGLNGLGIDYSNGAIEIGGAFLRTEVTRDGETYTEYDGTAIVKAKAITLSAIGSYAQYQGQTSLFIYAVLNMPLGGPAFFFVEGLAGGFGYNRSFILPPIDQIAPFPLVQEAMGKAPGAASTANLADELAKIRDYIPPDVGEYFIAVGLKYNSFKLVDSFALLSVSFGKHFEIDILGLSRVVVPPLVNKSPLAVVEMALSARFAPDEGILAIKAQLTNASYLLSPNCHLTGGFAFCTWFNPNRYAGDFVITLGGYHPHFKVPAHYPKVPRLGFNWQVTDKLSLKGDAYFALCSHAFMAGGHLEALYHDGALKAWFKAGADFLVEWKPYHYEASIYVDLGASYTFHFFGTHHITIDVGADLELWGPKFAGKAKIHIWVITVTIHFGSSSHTPQPIDWATFKSSFLPANDKVCSIAAGDGLTRTMKSTESTDGKERWLVNPKTFTLAVNTAIPIKSAYKRSAANAVNIGDKGVFGIGSMDIGLDQVESQFTATISKVGAGGTLTAVEDDFIFTPVKKKVPTGMWGGELEVDVNGTKFIDNAVCGFELSPSAVPSPGETDDVERRALSFSTTSVSNAYTSTGIVSRPADTTMDDTARRTRIRDTIVPTVDATTGKSTRDTLLEALDMDPAVVRVGAETANDYLIPPRILGQAA